MRVLRWQNAKDSWARASTAVMGVFDAMHLGHRLLFSRGAQVGVKRGEQFVAITFDEIPAAHRNPNFGGSILSTQQRMDLIAESGVAMLLVLPFDKAFRSLSAAAFLRQLATRFTVRQLVVGENFKLGSDGVPAIEMLKTSVPSNSSASGLGVDIVTLATHNDSPISSTGIRRLISLGRMEETATLLGRPYRIDLRGLPVLRQENGVRVPRNSISQIVPATGVYRCIAAVGKAKLETEVAVGKEEVSAVWTGSFTANVEYLGFVDSVQN